MSMLTRTTFAGRGVRAPHPSRRLTRQWLILICAVALGSCAREDPVQRFDLLAFSTTVSLSVYAPPPDFASLGIPALEARMAVLEQRWRSFGAGELGTLNAVLERGGCARTDNTTRALTERALVYRQLSDGLFDPTLGIEVEAWGFRDLESADASDPSAKTTRQTPDQKQAAPKGDISLKGDQICSNGPVRLDLGGIAKGAIVIELARLLHSLNASNAIINIGGDMLVLGKRGHRPWRVAIQHPRRSGVIATFNAHDGEAIFSSGDYHRARVVNGKRTHHILDPRTGAPATAGVATTVIHSNPLVADVAATALLVAGAGEFERTAEKLGVTRAVLVDSELSVHTLKNTGIRLPDRLDAP